MVVFRSEYVAAGGNRHPSAADWDAATGLIAYGADRNVALWKPLDDESRGTQALLRGHTDKVNAVKFFPSPPGGPQVILSGSVDKTIRIWQAPSASAVGFAEALVLEGHACSVNCLGVVSQGDFIVSGSADSTIKIWRLVLDGPPHATLLQTIQTSPRFFPLTLALGYLGSTKDAVLAVAGTKGFVQVYVAKSQGNFHHQATVVGHEAWVRSLTLARESSEPCSDLLLASASQDKYIRIWRIHQVKQDSATAASEQGVPLPNFEKLLSNKAHRLQDSQRSYSLTFEALLLGHEDWIYTVAWRSDVDRLQLLSASADNSLAIWEPDVSSGVWICTTRLGEISAQKGSTTATGSTGGFWIGLWSPKGESIVSLGRTGSWRLWNFNRDEGRWSQGIGISGHTKSVMDVAWAKDGTYLLSTGSDQTTRLHASWQRETGRSWHEFARPQIHGYDLNCIDSIGQSSFISGADEKLLRVFDEPKATADVLYKLCGIRMPSVSEMPGAANIPMLGLSNKAIENVRKGDLNPNGGLDEDEALDSIPETQANTSDLDHPPFEDQLARQTLWPECEKLYGHGYEISAVASSHDGTIVATGCRASSIDHAVVRLYRTKDWREVTPALKAHSLTVTCLRFSKDDQYLLSVGRDRQWATFGRDSTELERYTLKNSNPKGHSRMILNASWAPPEAGRIFATAGRDKTVKIWRIEAEGTPCITTIPGLSPVTAVDILPRMAGDTIVVAVGNEHGDVTIYTLSIPTLGIQTSHSLGDLLRPSKSITRLAWRPHLTSTIADTVTEGQEEDKDMQLAVASDDSSLRLFSVSITT